MRIKRLAWAKEYENFTLADWKRAMFLDETHFFIKGKHSCFVRSVESMKPYHMKKQAKHFLKKCFGNALATKLSGHSFLSKE